MIMPQTKRLLLLLLASIALLPLKTFAHDEPAQGLSFTILHTNDLHAHDESFMEHERSIGGMAKIAHIIRSIRAQDPNVITVDAGDIFQGTTLYKFYHGEVEVKMLNDAGYDIYTIGNHEFDDGPTNLAKQLKTARFAIISANLDTSKMPELAALVKPYVIKNIKGQKVAFIGAILPGLTEISLTTDNVRVKATGERWLEPIKDEISKLKSQGINKIVLVTHVGLDLDKELAQLPEVDAIIGGHSHTRLDRPVIVPHLDGSNCAIVQTGSYGRTLGKLDLSFDSNGRLNLAGTHYRLINITDKIHEEPDIKSYLSQKVKPFAKMRTTIDGIADCAFNNSFRNFPGDSPLGDLIADAMAEAGHKFGATIALQNRGGIRSGIEKGPISESEVEELLPFKNHLFVATVRGADLRKALENSVSGNLGGKFLDVHGIRFTYDPSRPAFQRILSLENHSKANSWCPIVATNKYRLAINDYSFKGGEGFDFSEATDITDTGKQLSEHFKNYLRHHKHIGVPSNGRIRSTSYVHRHH